MRKLFLVVLFIVLCAGCASKKADLYRGQMLGKSTTELLQCAGAPSGEFRHGALMVLTYTLTTPQFSGTSGASKVCDASVFIENDIVTNVTYRTVYGSETCEPIFRSCIVGAR